MIEQGVTEVTDEASFRGIATPAAVDGNAPKPQDLPARFGEIVALLMRSPVYQHLSLADLQWMVAPPLLTGQFAIVGARSRSGKSLPAPVGIALWACVSPAVDRKLEAQKKAGISPFRLSPPEWRSGDIVWLLDVVVPTKVRRAILDRLTDGPLKGRALKHYVELRSEKN